MAFRLPPLTDVVPSATIEVSSAISFSSLPSIAAASMTQGRSTAVSIATSPSDIVKLEDSSPTPSALTSADAETAALNGTPATSAVRKRKFNCISGRSVANLTPEKLAKKQANDRKAQRAIRERTKARIDYLERRVRELSSQKPSLDLQAALRQNEIIQAENREIRQALQTIMDILQPLLGKQKLDTLPFRPSRPSQPPLALPQ
ncbi:hypothetical protein CBS63078_10935 [Aspergillus niger]|nr:hypothetical protein CBS63078_10935 [Aspergillus niger]